MIKPYTHLKIVRTDSELELPLVDEKLRALGAQVVTLSSLLDESTIIEEARDADLILMCYSKISEKVIAEAKNLKGIIKYGVDIHAIDIEAAKKRQIPVVNIPEYAEETVAEGAFTLMIALAKKANAIQKTMQENSWAWPTSSWMGLDISGKTLGLVGVGKIGSKMARMAGQGFRMNVLGFDPFVSEETMKSIHVTKEFDLSQMLSKCDFVSVHCTLSPQTIGLIGEKELQSMKSSAFLINVSRGLIVDELALLKRLQAKQLAGAALDVYSKEPLSKWNHPLSPLFEMENVILWPHFTFYTQEAMERLQNETLQRCSEILSNQPVVVRSRDPRLRSQVGVVFAD